MPVPAFSAPPCRQRAPRAAGVVATAVVAALTWGAVLGTAPAAAAPVVAAVHPTSATDRALATKLTGVLTDPRVTAGTTSAVLMDAGDGRVVFARNPSQALTPASNTKLLTAAAAMGTLGPSYRFRTQVIRRAPVSHGVIGGNLYLKGWGDPTTRESDYASLAAQLRARGVRGVTGRLVVDATFFDSDRYNDYWSSSYVNDYYAAQTSALTVAPDDDLDSGTVILRVSPATRTGKKATVTVLPASARGYVKVKNQTVTSGSGASTISARRAAGTSTFTVRGSIRTGAGATNRLLTVNRPDLYAAAVFRTQLTKAGIRVSGPTVTARTPSRGRLVIATDYSMRLDQLLVPFLKLSNNLHAEALTKAMGRKRSNSGSWQAGTAATRAYLRSIKVSTAGLVLRDGSGLTRANRISTTTMGSLLVKVRRQSWSSSFYAALPVAGVTQRLLGGTLRHRMNGTAAVGNARGKTGTLTGVTALSGYVRDRGGRLYAFAMISNYRGSTPRPVEDTFVVTVATHRR
ncbi:MAG: D-alanyl-D-alanine carboxypeptidase/D-alanyl-D-alanine endopeptidase [Propionibacteriaceae bacterium]